MEQKRTTLEHITSLWHRRLHRRRNLSAVREGSRCREYRAAGRMVKRLDISLASMDTVCRPFLFRYLWK